MAGEASRAVVTEVMGYINPNPPPGAGILTKTNATPEEYKKARHLMVDNKEVQFVDARSVPGGLASWSLDKHGFMVTDVPHCDDWLDKKKVRAEYYPKLAEHAKKITGAKEGYCFLYLTRDENPQYVGAAYSRFAHTDAGPDTPPLWRRALKTRWNVPEEELDNSDLMMVNYWIPRDRPAYKDPLCLLDGSTVDQANDLCKIAYIDENGNSKDAYREDENAIVARLVGPQYQPRHRWVYISDQKPEEAWLFKQYDERDFGQTKMAFHNSFHDHFHDDKPKETHGRRSAEFRVLLTFPRTKAKL